MIGTPFSIPDACNALAAHVGPLYMLDYDLRCAPLRFHLNVWDNVRPDSDASELASLIFVPIGGRQSPVESGGRITPIFYCPKQRTRFRNWFRIYNRVFFGGDAETYAIPFPREGSIGGTMVEDGLPTPEEALRSPSIFESIFEQATSAQIKALHVDWTWIAANCKRRVVRTLGGWIFASKAEAAHFKLAKSD